MGKRALIVGASGLVGGYALQYLLLEKDCESVTALVRKKLPLSHPKLAQIETDFSTLNMTHFDDVYCCLGSTMAKAGSEGAFRRVDYEIPLEVAKAAKAAGARRFLLVSALGANKDSKIFYSRVKGELEEALAGLGYESLKIFRPSLLMGARDNIRFGEFVGQFFMAMLGPLMFFKKLKRYKGIQAKVLGWAMVRVAAKNESGNKIYENEEIAPSGV